MKRKLMVATALLAGTVVMAQQRPQAPPPPPAAPHMDAQAVAPPPPPPAPPMRPPAPPARTMDRPDDVQAFLKRNPAVKDIGWTDGHVVRIHLRSGKEEVYDLNKAADAGQLQSRYGKLPVPPPPPPPPPVPRTPVDN